MGKQDSFRYEYEGPVREYLDNASEAIAKLVGKGQRVIDSVSQDQFINEETNAILLLYRHAVALLDAFAELARIPAVEAIKVVLRAFFEAKVSLEYILNAHTFDRAVAYQVQHIMEQIKRYKRFNPEAEMGKEFRTIARKDRLFPPDSVPDEDTTAAIQNLQEQLDREPFRSTYQKLVQGNGAEWYSIDDGPRKFVQLCNDLGYPAFTMLFYDMWSSTAHGKSAYMDSYFAAEDGGRVHAIRSLKGYELTLTLGLTLAVDFFERTLEKRFPKQHTNFVVFVKNIYHPFKRDHLDNVNLKLSE